jgi:SPP1 gp7 family putative phage head morphogenesis protein
VRTARPPRFPSQVERRYLAYLRKRIQAVVAVVRKTIIPTLDPGRSSREGVAKVVEQETSSLRTDASPEALAILDQIRQVFADRLPPDEGLIVGLSQQTDNISKAYVARLLVGVIPIHLDIDVTDWVAANVALIKSIEEQYLDDVALLITEAQAQGWSARRTGQAISQLTNTPMNRAKLIARDQIATLNSQVTKDRQTEAGILRYRWSTSQDERVRPEHAALEGRIFSWDDPPPEGHPGEPINCRCVAIPVFED